MTADWFAFKAKQRSSMLYGELLKLRHLRLSFGCFQLCRINRRKSGMVVLTAASRPSGGVPSALR